jgi:ribosome-associated toxin RatA of RatAB toxin-antitoxin module
MHTQNTVQIAGPLEEIVRLASDIERWPEILPHYRWVTLLEGGGDRKVVEMAARRGKIPVKWRAVQEIWRDKETPVIHFRHIGGPTKGMEVDWLFDPQPDRVDVTIRHDFRKYARHHAIDWARPEDIPFLCSLFRLLLILFVCLGCLLRLRPLRLWQGDRALFVPLLFNALLWPGRRNCTRR